MVGNGNSRKDDERSRMLPHEEFLELCALSTTGELSEDEKERLREHLARCFPCRQALGEFETVADLGAPLLSSELATPNLSERASELKEAAEVQWIATPSEIARSGSDSDTIEHRRNEVFALRNGSHGTHTNWNYVWMPFAAAVMLTVALGIYSYQVGKRHAVQVAQASPTPVDGKVDALEQQLSDVSHERQFLKAQLAEQDRLIRELQSQVEGESAALNEAKEAEANLERVAQKDKAERQQVAQEQVSLQQKLDTAQLSLERMQADLDSARHEREQDQLHAEKLEAQIRDLNVQLKQSQQTVDKQEDLLADDRDIRDLMGARDLYIAEVYDVARDGATQKAYGRIFYTRGKSLIFYAYDLDQQPGARNATTFQAWGQSGADRQQVLSLGIFYQDGVAKKRWVLKFDDPHTLEQINAVFVTVEPRGGSHKPSSRPLLFASLRIDPNHP